MTWPNLCIALAALARESIELFAAGLGVHRISAPVAHERRRTIPR
ncbi:MAG: hypothetical protein U5Q44_04530 [Dehalococcoidia bacterium]|nr:hypothetical protein [Dehalococcoidia bacterium]